MSMGSRGRRTCVGARQTGRSRPWTTARVTSRGANADGVPLVAASAGRRIEGIVRGQNDHRHRLGEIVPDRIGMLQRRRGKDQRRPRTPGSAALEVRELVGRQRIVVFRARRSGCDIMPVGMLCVIVAAVIMRARGQAGMMRNSGQRVARGHAVGERQSGDRNGNNQFASLKSHVSGSVSDHSGNSVASPRRRARQITQNFSAHTVARMLNSRLTLSAIATGYPRREIGKAARRS